MKFSVITITYNNLNGLKFTSPSVLSQTYSDYEWLVIDGKSTDGSIDFLKTFNRKPDVLVSEPDKGIYDAMNKGLSFASGDYVVFLNAGDAFASEKTLEKVSRLLLQNDKMPDFVYGDSLEKLVDGTLLYRKARSHKKIWWGMFTHHQAMYYRMSVIRKYKLKYDLSYKIAADHAFTARFLRLVSNISYIPEALCIFSKDDSLSMNKWRLSLKEQDIVRKEILNLNFAERKILYWMQYIWHLAKEKLPFVYYLRTRKLT